MKKSEAVQGTEREFMDIFRRLCCSRSSWQVWADLISAIACSLSNAADRTPAHYGQREKEFSQCIDRLGSVEAPAKILSIIVMALENEPEQDFLGKMYMDLNLGNHWKGQFFTPYTVCRLMSQITVGNIDRQIEEQGYISVCDPACGAGATLIAAANLMKGSRYNFQNHVIFVGQDVDRVAAQMCYIQLSLLGCAGYVCVGNTLTNPLAGPVLFPREKEGQELWYMPMFQSDIWQWRKVFNSLGSTGGTVTTEKTVEKERFYMFFDFGRRRLDMENSRFNENDIPEQDKKALRPETGQEAGKGMEAGAAVPEEGSKDVAEKEKPARQRAREKLEKELKAAKNKAFAEQVIGYLLKRCGEDEGFVQDVAQEHKTWQKCVGYIYSQAGKQAVGNYAAVRDEVVYEWAEDYYHKDDKAEEEQKAKKEAEKKAKQAEAAGKKCQGKEKPAKAAPAPEREKKEEKPEE